MRRVRWTGASVPWTRDILSETHTHTHSVRHGTRRAAYTYILAVGLIAFVDNGRLVSDVRAKTKGTVHPPLLSLGGPSAGNEDRSRCTLDLYRRRMFYVAWDIRETCGTRAPSASRYRHEKGGEDSLSYAPSIKTTSKEYRDRSQVLFASGV